MLVTKALWGADRDNTTKKLRVTQTTKGSLWKTRPVSVMAIEAKSQPLGFYNKILLLCFLGKGRWKFVSSILLGELMICGCIYTYTLHIQSLCRASWCFWQCNLEFYHLQGKILLVNHVSVICNIYFMQITHTDIISQ